MLAESSIVQRLDDPAVALCVLVLAGTGIKLGGFRTTLLGFGLLLSLDAALALAGWGAGMLVKVEVPPGYATVAAFLVVFLAGTAATVGSMQGFIGEYAARLSPITDAVLGALAGVLAGVVVAATVHIGWSMGTCQEAKEVPPEYRFQPEEVEFRVGEAMLANVSGVSNSLAKELLERYRLGIWFEPLPVPEPEVPAEGGDDDSEDGDTPRPSVDDGEGAGEEGVSQPGPSGTPGPYLPPFPDGGLPPADESTTPGSVATPGSVN